MLIIFRAVKRVRLLFKFKFFNFPVMAEQMK